jgi:basic membrane lipoprotein Med (substrate-binding protein (PBP1-ABC) superfamily)
MNTGAHARAIRELCPCHWLLLFLLGCAPDEGLSKLVVSVLYPLEGNGASSVASAMRQGVLQARVGSDFVFEEHTPQSEDDARELLDAALAPQQGRRLVMAAGALYATALDERACDLSNMDVLLLEGQPAPCSSLRSVKFQTFVPAFLAGVLALSAQSVAPRHVAGVISAAPSAELTRLIQGFMAGAAYVGGSTEALELTTFDTEALSDPEQALVEIRALADAVDVLLIATDTGRDVILEGVRMHNDAHPEQLLRLIGVDQDLSVYEAELTLGSILRHFESEVRSSILAAQVDAFLPGQVVRGFHDGQTELIVNAAFAETALGAVPFEDCKLCKTLTDAVREAERAAVQAESVPLP